MAEAAMLQCEECGYENRPAANFCGQCAKRLGPIGECPHCGAANPAPQRYCDSCGGSLAQPELTSSPASGSRSIANGRYQLKRLLGEGGRKRVFLARDTRLDRDVALAVIKTEGLDGNALKRVHREAEAMGRLGDHPHIVTVYDIGTDGAQLFIVSQFMKGGDLGELLQRSPDQRLAVEEAVRIGEQISSGLEYAHTQGIVHRDLKPQNVWLTDEGTAKLGDFGLAATHHQSRITTEGSMVGTVAYVSAEQAMGRPLDHRADLYSLGVLFYELVCGRQPFLGDDAIAVLSQHVNTAPVPPSWHNAAVSQPLENLILGLLAKAPEDRPPDAAAVRRALESLHGGLNSSELVALRGDAPDPLTSAVFVGRQREMTALREATENALAGRGRMVMLAGEVGIGKTRLAAELGTYASLRGAQVLWGRCNESGGAPAYWPWIQIIREYVEDRESEHLKREMGSGAADIARVVSEVRKHFPGLEEREPMDGEQLRFRLFDSLSHFFGNAARAQPLVLVLDDLQWADPASVLLLRFLAAEMRAYRLLVVGTYREKGIDLHHELSEALAALRREPLYTRLGLRGLPFENVRDLVAGITEQEVGRREHDLARHLYRQSEGNPFFIEELVRHLMENDRLIRRNGRWEFEPAAEEDLALPAGIRGALAGRLDRLSEPCQEALSWASVIGREFRVELLERVTDRSGEVLLETLEEALEAGLIEETRGPVGGFRFSHALIRDALYDQLGTARRVHRHALVADALECLLPADNERRVAELAGHLYEAMPLRGAEKAIDYSLRAGRRATAMLAYEDAVGHLERAVEALDLKQDASQQEKCELLLELGNAQWRTGDTAAVRRTLSAGAELARRLEAPELLARTALSYGGGLGGFGVANSADRKLVELLEEALLELGSQHSGLRIRLLARLAVELYYDGSCPLQRRAELSAEAVALADRLGDPHAQLVALYSRQWTLLGPDNLDEQLAGADEMLAVAQGLQDPEMEFVAHHLRLHVFLQRGEIGGVDQEIAICTRLAQRLRQPVYDWQIASFGAMRSLISADLKAAEQQAADALSIGQRGQPEAATVHYGVHLYIGYWAQGRFDELRPMIGKFAERYPGTSWCAAAAFLYAEVEELEAASREFQYFARDGFAEPPRDTNWLLGVALLSATCARLGDVEHAATLYAMLAPYEHRNVAVVAGAGCIGSAALMLGMLARCLGRPEDAGRHFQTSIDFNLKLGYRVMVARSMYEHAAMLVEDLGEDHAQAASQMIDRALDETRELGMHRLTEQLLQLRFRGTSTEETTIDALASSLENDLPDLGPRASSDGTLTILFSDIEGSTELNERVGDNDWLDLLKHHNQLVRQQVRSQGGFEVKSQGDGFMVAFRSARRALACACGIQRALTSDPRTAGAGIRVRIGVHTGDVVRHQDDFFGRTVMVAARIAGEARGGEVVVSSLVRELVTGLGEFSFSTGRELELRGVSQPQSLFTVDWSDTYQEGQELLPADEVT